MIMMIMILLNITTTTRNNMLLQRRYVYIQMSVATDLHRFEQMKGILSFCL